MALAAAGTAAAVLVATAPHGPLVSTDSVLYLSTAQSVRDGHGFLFYQGLPLTQYPPGYPLALAAAGASLLGARLLNAVCLALVVALAWPLLRRHVRSAALRIAGVAAVAVAPPLLYVSTAAWSEPPFLVLVLGTALALDASVARPRSRRWAAVAGLLAGGAFCLRYSGLWLIVAVPAVLLVANRGALTRRERAIRAGLPLLAAAVPLVLVVNRNLRLVHGRPFGGRGPANTSAAQALWDSVAVIARWFAPPGGSLALLVLAAVALVAAVVLAARGRRAAPVTAAAPIWPLAALVAGYVAFLLAATGAYLDPVGPRLLSPVFVLTITVALAALERLLAGARPRGPALVAATVLVAIWLAAAVQTSEPQLARVHDGGGDYTRAPWRRSALVALLERDRIRPTYSNRTDGLWFRTSVVASCWPTRTETVCTHYGPDLTLLGARDPAYLAWFDEPDRRGPYLPAAARGRARLDLVRRVADGALYRVSAAG